MRKKILGSLFVVAIAAVAAFNVNMNNQESEMSALSLANVEALAGNEKDGWNPGGAGGGSNSVECYSIINTCWFWNCSDVYRCHLVDCYTVSADDYSSSGTCRS